MKIDEPGRDKISVNVDNVFPAHTSLLMNCGNFSSFHDNFEAIANSVGENQTRVRKNHFLVSDTNSVGESVGFPGRPASSPTMTSPTGTDCLCSLQSPFSLLAMNLDYDVVIIGGAFSGAATALMLKRKRPEARVLIIEKTAEFDRKVGESTTEVSSCYMTRILGLTHYLGHHQLAKQGLRLWFSNRPDQRFDDCVEVGTRYQSRLPGFQVDRAKLDSHMLDLAVQAGCELWRPAKVTNLELNDGNGQRVSAAVNGGECAACARWIVDATGRTAMLARKLGYLRPNTEHPINAVWARFSGVKEWDSYDWRERFPDYANRCRTAREWATNHLFGRGWWVWIIPLQGGDVSAGIVYDSRIFKLPEGPSLGQRLHTHILGNPVGREIFGVARVIEGDVHALSMLPYHSEKVCGDGWAAVGDATGFIDPLYSPGLDFCSYTSYYVADLLARSLAGEDVTDQLRYYDEQYSITYRYWFESLYKDKYYYMGDAELMSAALLLDVSGYYLGLVRGVYRDPECGFLNLPFTGLGGRFARNAMTFYSRRLVALANRRWATGYYGKRNAGWRELYDGFVPDIRIHKQIRRGLLRWWKCELINLALMLRGGAAVPAKQASATVPTEAW
ncbi:MAG: NAD(P)/FAD-dependent oxidoreductase [Verrucomicrobia bacterium]|nr:MAG: NAD(P)/FAD-dependent oxidoreductase [Verrucomicrobiota bacterium]PYL42170.1 MAG: NAD(P)/FAD-dependent oxidoreductase [Verrucomicrobiota bacterium]